MDPDDAEHQAAHWSEWGLSSYGVLYIPDELPPYDAKRSADLMKEIFDGLQQL